MTDYKEEQQNELEALEAIYSDEFKLIEEAKCFEISVFSEHDEDEDIKFSACIEFKYVEYYPDEGPIIEVRSLTGLDDSNVTTLEGILKQQIEENLGMVMVFTLVSEAQEFLNQTVENRKKEKEAEKLRKIKEAEKAELAKITGTPVTYENFMAWKLNFYKQTICDVKNETKEKLTGRQLFEQNELLGTSDEAFLKDDVQVDESLFQEMDDLDLEDLDLQDD